MKHKKTFFILISVVLFLLIGCASQKAMVKDNPDTATAPSAVPPDYVIQPGDQLDIKFFYNPELNENVTVRPDGKIALQLLDEIRAGGLSPAQLDEVLTREYAKELKKPMVTVIVRSFSSQRVYVGGEVNTPNLVDLRAGMTALQAVINAGGLRETAKPEGVIVIRKGPDSRPIPIRVDLKQALSGENAGADFQLKPYDIVYVPKTAIAKANKFVNQYIEQLLLFRGVSFGFSYRADGWRENPNN